jgi:putative tricarboxylic transport membrane protein
MVALDFSKQAAVYPKSIIVLMGILSIFICLNGLRKTKNRPTDGYNYEGEESELNFAVLKYPFIVLAFVIGYIMIMDIIGFFTSTAFLTAGLLWFMGIKKWQTFVYTILGITIFIYVLFVLQLNVRLPLGILI